MADVGHNSGLTEDQKRALGFHHCGQYERSLKAKKDADAAFKNTCKLIKSEGTSIDAIKLMISLGTPAGEEALKADLEEKLRVARWMGSEVGSQLDLLDVADRRPIEDRAYEEGKIAGMKGETARAPDSYSGATEQRWLAGHHDGQEILMSTLDLTKAGAKQVQDEEAEQFEEAA